jgi:hypothetical protein
VAVSFTLLRCPKHHSHRLAVWRLKHDYARDIFYCVAEATLRAEAPSYKTILDLDKKVREMSFPTSLKPYLSPTDGEELYYSSSLSIRDFYASQNRTVSTSSLSSHSAPT